MAATTEYASFRSARENLKPILDTATSGRLVTVDRGADGSAAVVSADALRTYLAATVPSRARVISEDGAWVALIPGLPVAVEAEDFEDAIADMLEALREYADDWQDRLYTAPNHRGHWGLVNLIRLSSDVQLRSWLLTDG